MPLRYKPVTIEIFEQHVRMLFYASVQAQRHDRVSITGRGCCVDVVLSLRSITSESLLPPVGDNPMMKMRRVEDMQPLRD